MPGEHVRVYIYIHGTPRSIMAETDWNNEWNWDEKSEDYMLGYVNGSRNFVIFTKGYEMVAVDGELIYMFEDDE